MASASAASLSARRVLPPILALGVVGLLVVEHRHDVGAALDRVSTRALLALAGLHLVALFVRAEAWRVCVVRAGGEMPRRPLHWASGLRFTADTVMPTYIGLFVRVAVLKRMLGARAPSVGQMVAADGIMLVIEGVIVLALLVAVTPAAGLSWWISIVACAGLVAIIALALHLRTRWPHRRFTHILHVLEWTPNSARLTVLLAIVVCLQPVRFVIALHAIGVDADALEGLFAFIATNVFGALPIGPGPSSIGGLATAVHDAGTGRLVATGVLLAGTAVIASVTYVVAAGVERLVHGHLARRRQAMAG
jgi:hypothetical protein